MPAWGALPQGSFFYSRSDSVLVPFRESTAFVKNAPIRREQIKAIRRPGSKGAYENTLASCLEARVVR